MSDENLEIEKLRLELASVRKQLEYQEGQVKTRQNLYSDKLREIEDLRKLVLCKCGHLLSEHHVVGTHASFDKCNKCDCKFEWGVSGEEIQKTERETNRKLNRRIGQLEKEVARRDRSVAAAVRLADWTTTRIRNERSLMRQFRNERSRLRWSVWARIVFVFTGGGRK